MGFSKIEMLNENYYEKEQGMFLAIVGVVKRVLPSTVLQHENWGSGAFVKCSLRNFSA